MGSTSTTNMTTIMMRRKKLAKNLPKRRLSARSPKKKFRSQIAARARRMIKRKTVARIKEKTRIKTLIAGTTKREKSRIKIWIAARIKERIRIKTVGGTRRMIENAESQRGMNKIDEGQSKIKRRTRRSRSLQENTSSA